MFTLCRCRKLPRVISIPPLQCQHAPPFGFLLRLCHFHGTESLLSSNRRRWSGGLCSCCNFVDKNTPNTPECIRLKLQDKTYNMHHLAIHILFLLLTWWCHWVLKRHPNSRLKYVDARKHNKSYIRQIKEKIMKEEWCNITNKWGCTIPCTKIHSDCRWVSSLPS